MGDAGYAWDEAKRVANLAKHGTDFRDAVEVFERPHLTIRSDRVGERRHISLGLIAQAVVAVVWTDRDGVVRIISARAARRDERQVYRARFGA